MSYRQTIHTLAQREAGKMRGQLVRSSARIVILAGLLGTIVAVRQGRL